jgi:acylphosphatase
VEQRRIHVIVKGRVQGVYYRASTQEQAQALGLTGWVRNLANGDVEFEAQGSQDKLDSLLLWAQNGPARAQVTTLSCNHCTLQTGENAFNVVR